MGRLGGICSDQSRVAVRHPGVLKMVQSAEHRPTAQWARAWPCLQPLLVNHKRQTALGHATLTPKSNAWLCFVGRRRRLTSVSAMAIEEWLALTGTDRGSPLRKRGIAVLIDRLTWVHGDAPPQLSGRLDSCWCRRREG